MLTFYKHIIDDNNWHYGAYLAFLCLKIDTDVFKSNKPLNEIVQLYDKIKNYELPCSANLKVKYKKEAGYCKISFQYKNNYPRPAYQPQENKKMYDNKQTENIRCHPFVGVKMHTPYALRLQKLNAYARELNAKLPYGRMITLAEPPDYLDGRYWEDHWVKTRIYTMKHNIAKNEKDLKIPSKINFSDREDFKKPTETKAVVPSAPSYNPAYKPKNIISNAPRATFYRKKQEIDRQMSNVNVNVNINIGTLACNLL